MEPHWQVYICILKQIKGLLLDIYWTSCSFSFFHVKSNFYFSFGASNATYQYNVATCIRNTSCITLVLTKSFWKGCSLKIWLMDMDKYADKYVIQFSMKYKMNLIITSIMYCLVIKIPYRSKVVGQHILCVSQHLQRSLNITMTTRYHMHEYVGCINLIIYDNRLGY